MSDPPLGKCAMCGQHAVFVDSHIFQGAFWNAVSDGEGVPRLVANTPGVHPRRLSIGAYSQFTCEDGERVFNPYDTYAK